MKKKYLKYFVFFVLPLLSTGLFANEVRAEEKCQARISLTRIKTLTVESLFNNGSHTYFSISVDGAIGMCLEPGKHLNTGDLVIQDACTISNDRAKQALNYCSSSGCGDSISRIVAQTYTWGGTEQAAAEAVCSYNGKEYGLKRKTCLKEQMTSGGGTAVDIYRAIKGTSTAGDFTCWQDGDKQPVATRTPKECEKYVCPPNTVESGKDITECVTGKNTFEKCVEEECGEEASCHGVRITLNGSLQPCIDDNTVSTSTFNEYFGEEDINSDDSMNGRRQNVNIGSGKYCSLYCLETKADANLPGGIANPIHLGSAITWPTSPKTNTSKFGNRFPLLYHGKMTCRIQVAPNLTYGESCTLEPIVDYDELRKDLEKAYKDNTKAKSAVDDANKYLSGHTNGASITTLTKIEGDPYGYLNKDNEPTRKDKIDSYDKLRNPDAPKLFEKFKTTAESNLSSAKSNVEIVWKKYCSDHYSWSATASHSCTNGGTYSTDANGVGSCSTGTVQTSYSCSSGATLSGSTCYCTKAYAKANDGGNTNWWEEAVKKWEAAVNVLKPKHEQYKKYIELYKKITDLYNEIYLCGTVVPDIFKTTCNGPECQFYKFDTNASMSYTDEGEYGTSYNLEIEQSANYSCPGCSDPIKMFKPNEYIKKGGKWIYGSDSQKYFEEKIKNIEDKKFNIDTGDVIYRLPNNLYNYVNKDTLKWEMNLPSTNNYITHGLSKNGEFLFSNLPTSFKNKVDKKYDLKIENIQLGHEGHFRADYAQNALATEDVGFSFSPYVCHYTVTAGKTDSPCTCPPGTKYAGMMLTAIIEDNDMTCADAIFEYCDRDSPGPDCEENCEIFCENDPTIEITACVNEGHTRSWCEKEFCSDNPPGDRPPGGNPKYYCPTDKGYKNGGMEITNCVISRVSKGSTMSEAQKYCEARLCNLDQLIIYRTIDLKNPFPSIDADEKTVANWPDVGAFNLAIHGRYPGSNWNSQELVQSRIHTVKREDRKVKDNDIYKEKKPLYHIELDTATIKKIRQYNSKQKKEGGYNDNKNLVCNRTIGNDILGAGCYSKFLHNSTYGADTTGAKSLCGNARTPNDVAKCLEVVHR